MDKFQKKIERLLYRLVKPLPKDRSRVFEQTRMIESSDKYNKKRKKQGKEPIFVLSQTGVCAGLAGCFAHSIMVKPTQQENIDVFTQFLIRLQTTQGLESFLEEYGQAQQAYLGIKNDTTPMTAQKEEIINNFQKLQTQLAYYDTCVMAYDFENDINDGGLLQDKIQQYQPEYFKIAGITPFCGNVSFDIKLQDLEKFFTPQDSTVEESEVLSPFVPGGTYLINLPGHMIAVHYDLDGSMMLYDPNEYNYLTNREQVREFKKLCALYVINDNLESSGNYLKAFSDWFKIYSRGHSPNENLEISVIPVQLCDKSIQKTELLEQEEGIKKRMVEAGYNAMLKKINNTVLDFPEVYRILFNSVSFQGEDILIKIFPLLFDKISGDKELMKALELNIINLVQNSKEEALIKILPVILEKISDNKELMGLLESSMFRYATKESIAFYFKTTHIAKDFAKLYAISSFHNNNSEILKAVITVLPPSFWTKSFLSVIDWREKDIIKSLINQIQGYIEKSNTKEAQSLLDECARVVKKDRMIEILNAVGTQQSLVAFVEKNYPDSSFDLQQNTEGKVLIARGAFDNANEAHTAKTQAAPGKK